ncbi:hypothetical protein [Rhizobium sp. LC145]|uniref:hypothetical protein n=1 Tax=Rhizobium sp. LC145 TaxID=1120688 RepID=UPI00062A439F|nr:hypothetical protein [Rhizobium sp. LC145]KKX29219.1 hypothetical protein YH62_15580 [Rhizobium sp. LC145]TKT68819.1 hypothetical protein FDR95_00115 [Rhizobiaceae bacterium LC148]
MSLLAGFIVELVRAANEVNKLRDDEKCRLLQRAVRTIRDLRVEIGIPESAYINDAAIELLEAYAQIKDGRSDADVVRAALLKAAGMIRDLKIIRDAKDEVIDGDATH